MCPISNLNDDNATKETANTSSLYQKTIKTTKIESKITEGSRVQKY